MTTIVLDVLSFEPGEKTILASGVWVTIVIVVAIVAALALHFVCAYFKRKREIGALERYRVGIAST